MNKQFKSLITFILIIAILAIGYFGIYGYWGKLTDAKTARDSSQLQNDKVKKAQQDLNAFLNVYENQKDLVAQADRALPKGRDGIPMILENMSRMTAESGLNLAQINFQEGNKDSQLAQKNSIRSVDMTARFSGTYESFRDFLLRIQTNLRIIDLLNVTVEQGSDSQSNILSFNAHFRSYYQE